MCAYIYMNTDIYAYMYMAMHIYAYICITGANNTKVAKSRHFSTATKCSDSNHSHFDFDVHYGQYLPRGS